MPSVPLRNRIRSVISAFVRKRMIRARDQFLQAAQRSCSDVQQETLQRLLRLNQDSRFSETHGLHAGLTVAEFRRCLPVCDYETFRSSIECMTSGDHRALLGSRNPLMMYAVTSGTTSKSKLIPVTQQFVHDYRRGWQHWGMGVYQSHPQLSHLRMVQISSAYDRSRTEDGTPCGNISGLASAMQKKVVQKLYTIPNTVADIEDPKLKRRVVATFALTDAWVGMFITANPSTLLQLLETADCDAENILRDIHDGRLSSDRDKDHAVLKPLSRHLKRNPDRARELQTIVERTGRFTPIECWPRLVCLGLWTGGSANAYLPAIRQAFGEVPIRDHGLHASEGRMTIPFEDGTSSGVLDVESHFFEFIPYRESESASPIVLQAHELELDEDYFILLTTASGIYRYNMFDVVRCTGFHGTTPRLAFLHKGAHISSITGEKITESQVVAAVQNACQDMAKTLRQFTLTPVWGEPPHYRLYIEADDGVVLSSDLLSRMARCVDEHLCRINCEYADKRKTDRLALLQTNVLAASSWQSFQENRLAQSGGSPEQYKHPCLMPDGRFEGKFLKLTAEQNSPGLRATQ